MLDGGAMFGVVQIAWSRHMKADANNLCLGDAVFAG